jgi:putative transposase
VVARAHRSSRALSDVERAEVLQTLNSERFADLAPPQIWARLLDDGVYLCSVSTMYRLLRAHDAVRERRRQARHPAHVKPELMASMPNQVWSWDITKLKGPVKWVWYYLYVVLDVYSRYTPGWLVAERESSQLAQQLLSTCLDAERIGRDQLTIHADRGSPMTAKSVALLLADLGVTRSHSRPHQSNDNPYSEAQIKTMKYCPTFPDRFGSIQHARAFADTFFTYYNLEHRHSGIGWHTPFDVHHGLAEQVRAARQASLDAAYATHPERFHHPPQAPRIPDVAWINRPTEEESEPVSNP